MNIVRIEQGGSKGYQLKWASGSKWFSDRKHGGQEGARRAAQRMKEIGERRIADAAAHAERKARPMYASNASGVTNAAMVWRAMRTGDEFLYASAKYKTSRGTWSTTYASVHRWGVEEAIKRALIVHHLPPLEEEEAVKKLKAQAQRMLKDVAQVAPPKTETRARKTVNREARA